MLKFDLDGQGGQFDKDQILRRADYGQVKHISSWAPGSWPKFTANADFLAEFTLEINVANPPLGAASFVSFRFTSRDLDRSFQFTTLPLFGLPRSAGHSELPDDLLRNVSRLFHTAPP